MVSTVTIRQSSQSLSWSSGTVSFASVRQALVSGSVAKDSLPKRTAKSAPVAFHCGRIGW
jgi:hypothetical protein